MKRWLVEGRIGRGAYAVAGLLLFGVKHNLDRVVATALFGKRWGPFNYLVPPEHGLELGRLSADDKAFFLTLLWLALPFVAAGVALTLARLRSAGLPPALAVVFFIPFVNLIFFVAMSLVPEKVAADAPHLPRSGGRLDRFIPKNPIASAALSLLVTVPVGLLSLLVGVDVFARYGWGVLVGLPFAMGLVSVLIYGYHEPRPIGPSLLVAALSPIFLAVLLMGIAIEGVVCLAMAAPLFEALALLGGLVGYVLQKRPQLTPSPALVLAIAATAPLLMGAEHALPPEVPLFEVRTEVEIAAPPESVWRNVVAFSELPAPTEWLFRSGIAYPMRATISGRGVGAVRHCIFSTGAFVEPITVWDEPRRLAFSVSAQPDPMQEWTPYRDVHPAHLDYLRSERGEFRLTPLPGGGTRLVGTTWYRHAIFPVSYWRPLSDAIIHRIHARVLEHIKRESEAAR